MTTEAQDSGAAAPTSVQSGPAAAAAGPGGAAGPSAAPAHSSSGEPVPVAPAGASGPQGRLTVASVARRLGVAPATLRTWARRYGLGPSEHAAGAHRRYTPADLARLETMRRLTLEGVAPAEAAQVALAWSAADPTGAGRAGAPPAGAPLAGAPLAGAPLAGAPLAGAPLAGALRGGQAARPAEPTRAPTPGRGGPGGRVLALPGAAGVVRGLGRAAMALDSTAVTDIVRTELDEHGVLATWEHVLLPVLIAVGARWAATGEGVEVEHLLSDCVATALRQHAHGAAEPASGRPVLLACAPGDQHVLPLNALAAGLAERGTGARVLGAAMPTQALQAAVRRTGPAVLFLWSQLPQTADVAVLDAIPVTRPPTTLLVGGPGWDRDVLPPRVVAVDDLPHALDLVAQALHT